MSKRSEEISRCGLTGFLIVSIAFPPPPQENSACSEKWGEEAAALFSRAVGGPMKGNLLINFAYADFEEVCVCFANPFLVYFLVFLLYFLSLFFSLFLVYLVYLVYLVI